MILGGNRRALIVVDMQKDFCEGGALAVSGGNLVAYRIADFIGTYGHLYDKIVFTKDWHNALPDDNGGHFSSEPDYKDSWPVHCVSLSKGATFHSDISPLVYDGLEAHDRVFYKGQGKPDYSGFQGVNRNGIGLHDYLQLAGIGYVDVCGIAGDYCVKETALDAVKLNYHVSVLEDKVASVGGHEATHETVGLIFTEQWKRDSR